MRRPLRRGAPDRRRPDARRGARARGPGRRAEPGATVVVNPTARARTGLVEITVPGEGRSVVVDADGRAATDRRSSARSAATPTRRWSPARRCVGCSTCSAAPSSPAARSPAYEITRAARRRRPVRHRAAARPSPGEQRIDLGEVRERMLALGDAGATTRLRLHRRAGAARAVRHRRDRRASAGRRFTACSTPAPHPRRSGCRRERRWRTSTCASRSMRDDGHVRDRDRRRAARHRASAGSSTAVTAATRTTTPRPTTDRVVDTPGSRASSRRSETGPVRAPRRGSTADYTWPADAVGDVRSCSARSDETVRVDGAHHARAPGGRTIPAGDARDRQPGTRSPSARALPAARTGRRAPTPSARSRSCTAASPPRAARTSSACRRSRRAGSSTRPTARSGSRSCTTGCSSTRWSTTAASSRSRCSGRSDTSRVPSRRCGPNPAGPTVPVARRADARRRSASSTRCMLHAGDWRAADCYGAADAFLVPFERARAAAGSRHDAPRDRCGVARRRRRGLGRAARAGRLVVRVFRTAADPGPVTIEHEGAPARGWVVDLRGRRRRSVRRARSSSRPWEICTV